MGDNRRRRGLPVDPITERPISQAALFMLSPLGRVEMISALNPLWVRRFPFLTDDATIGAAINVGNMASVKIAEANPARRFLYVHANGDSKPVWIKLQSAAADNDKKGIWVERKAGVNPFWQMPTDNIYTGEISAIADSVSVDVFVTEY